MIVKHPKLKIKKGNKTFYYICNTLNWNWFLNRYYPVADLIMTSETLN